MGPCRLRLHPRWPTGPWSASGPTPRWRSPASPGRTAGRRRSRSATSAGPSRRRTGARSTATCGCPAGARTSATGRRRSRCTCCGGCCVASPRSRHARPGSPRARLFVALDPPGAARDALAAWRERAFGARDDVRLPDAATLHVTLAFLGYRPEKEIPVIGSLLRDACAGRERPELAAKEVMPLPPRRPRLFALDLADAGEACVALQAAVSGALEAERIYKPEKRPFWPHITLARVKRDRRAVLGDVPDPPAEEWSGEAVTLYRSTLRPQGALYEPLARVELD